MSCGSPMSVAAAPILLAIASAIRNGIGVELFAQQRGPDNRRKNVADDVMIEKRGKPAGDQHQDQQKPRGMFESCRNAAGHQVVKSGQAELG